MWNTDKNFHSANKRSRQCPSWIIMCFKLKKRSANHLFFPSSLEPSKVVNFQVDFHVHMNEPSALGTCVLPHACTALEKQGRGSLRRRNPRSTKICGFILPWTPVYNHWGFLGQSSEDTWALIKMSFTHFAKKPSLHAHRHRDHRDSSLPRVNSVISAEITKYTTGCTRSSSLCHSDLAVACRVYCAFNQFTDRHGANQQFGFQ